MRSEGKGRLKSKELNLLGLLRSVLQKLDSGLRRGPGQERTPLSFDVPPTSVAFSFRFYLFIAKTDLNIDRR